MFSRKFYSNKNFIKVLAIGFVLSIFFSLASFVKVSAAFPTGCDGPFGIPTSCPTACESSTESRCFVPDFQCSNAKLVNPSTECCNNKCNNETGIGTIPTGDIELIRSFNIFGTQFSITTTKIPNLINLAISSFLGLVSAYALIRGMYVGAVLRTRATSSEDIAKVNKEIVNMIIGFVLAWSFIFIIQFIGSILGFSVSDLNFTNTGSVITIN